MNRDFLCELAATANVFLFRKFDAEEAEPAAALYEKGRVHHVGVFPELEEEMTGFAPLTATKSPDRMDALVWALAELTKGGQRFILA